ncbi:helix-turn-helix domain-containing protein [Subsaximicrobium wynnwilliamsii]|uniref:Helix-turn-helix domain-containing protein n=1 Tax=Subsaximicrobium wynnwilliamsii TaxID=291179 RepID=A0A5C6ZE17_9FLAO|nr:helix-turn-helix domain-containing protein [Subsaximicrobium wynnwilliamsii]TXD80827.1 helix-turn-helix domain-containing protein [Subsaximicrobium wynnwilliamsii]TXD87348.1 helix-turn-helix domain-containing protein [Subsaximicrobium wynnwilliamsii]TXE00953.1 helix-turn-helix domain-containing protein [Subsaximicrobium wynnwilliamsii]
MTNQLSIDQVFINNLNTIIEDHIEDDQFGVEELAIALGISRSQLHRKLNAINGKSTSQFIREFRLEKAMEMLQDDVATASEISYKVGFNSPTYFNTSFHQYYGYPPGEVKFRNHLVNEDEEEIQASNAEKQPISIKRKLFNRTSFFIVALAILVIISFSYYNYSTSANTGPSENKESIKQEENTIAVLPLKNWSGDPELEYISDGMTDAIIAKLSQIQAIKRVMPFTSIVKYKDTDKDINTIAKELGVKYVLEGNFKLSGTQVQSNLNLVEAGNNKHLWSLEYTGVWNSDEIFELQASIAENIANKMKVNIGTTEIKSIKNKPTANEEAYKLYLRGQYEYSKLSKKGFDNAIYFFEQAISIDSSFIDPYAGLAKTHLIMGLVWGGESQIVAEKEGRKYYYKTVQLYQKGDLINQSELLRIKMMIEFHYDWDVESSIEDLNFVAESPNLYWEVYGMAMDIARKTGRFQLALTLTKRNLTFNPSNPGSYASLAQCYYMQGKNEMALQILKENDTVSADDYFYLLEASRVYYYLSEYKSSRQLLNIFMKIFTDRPPVIIWLNAVLNNVDGNKESQNYLDQLHQQYNTKVSGSPAWFLALYYAHIKDYDNTFVWLQKSYDRHEVEMTWLKEEPLLRPLRTDPRYIELYDKVGFAKIAPITPYVD